MLLDDVLDEEGSMKMWQNFGVVSSIRNMGYYGVIFFP